MSNYTRGEFLGLSALIAGGAALRGLPFGELASEPAQAPQQRRALDPDLIVVNARVYTVDPARRSAEAFAVKGDRLSERHLHKKFSRYKIRGEWFRASSELLDFVERLSLGEVSIDLGEYV